MTSVCVTLTLNYPAQRHFPSPRFPNCQHCQIWKFTVSKEMHLISIHAVVKLFFYISYCYCSIISVPCSLTARYLITTLPFDNPWLFGSSTQWGVQIWLHLLPFPPPKSWLYPDLQANIYIYCQENDNDITHSPAPYVCSPVSKLGPDGHDLKRVVC